MTSNIATLPSGKSQIGLTPQTLDEAMRFADLMAKSSIVPKDYQGNPGNILVAVQWGAEIGLAPLQSMQSIAVINGRPSIWGDAMLALVRASGLMEYIKEDPTDEGCKCTLKRRGEAEVTRSFSVEDAKKAGLWGKQGPWQTAPRRMMQMRARAFALRDVFTDVLRGVYVAEEAQDMPAEKDITAESISETKAPKTRAEKARAAIEDRRKDAMTVPPLAVPELAEVMAAISAADTPEAMTAAGDLAKRLTDDAEKREARQKYADKLHALKAAEAPSVTFAEVADRLQGAKDLDALDTAADLIHQVADEGQKAELVDLYKQFREGMQG